MSLIYLTISCLAGAGIATFLCKFPDWWAAREFASLGGPVEIIDPPVIPAETVSVGGHSFHVPK